MITEKLGNVNPEKLAQFVGDANELLNTLERGLEQCAVLAGQADWGVYELNRFHAALWDSCKAIRLALPGLQEVERAARGEGDKFANNEAAE